jgi:hypothetical protein
MVARTPIRLCAVQRCLNEGVVLIECVDNSIAGDYPRIDVPLCHAHRERMERGRIFQVLAIHELAPPNPGARS